MVSVAVDVAALENSAVLPRVTSVALFQVDEAFDLLVGGLAAHAVDIGTREPEYRWQGLILAHVLQLFFFLNDGGGNHPAEIHV